MRWFPKWSATTPLVSGVRPANRIVPIINEGVDIYAKAGGAWTSDPEQAQKDEKGQPIKYGKKVKAVGN